MTKTPGWPYRSILFVPGHKADWIRKTTRYNTDAVILDLEDAVPPAEKVAAREVTREGITFLQSVGIGAFVRVNAHSVYEDVLGVATPGLSAICQSKLSTAEEVRELADILSYVEGRAGIPRGSVHIIAIPETAQGLCDVRALAAASPRVKSVMTSIIDRLDEDTVFMGDTALAHGFIPTQEGLEQAYITSKVCLESRAGGAPYPMAAMLGTRIGDDAAARRIAARIKSTGFTGCVCIHPSHVAIANEYFRPSTREIEFAAGVLKAMKEAEANGLWAVNFRGMMIDQANVAIAEATLAEARRYGMPIPDRTSED